MLAPAAKEERAVLVMGVKRLVFTLVGRLILIQNVADGLSNASSAVEAEAQKAMVRMSVAMLPTDILVNVSFVSAVERQGGMLLLYKQPWGEVEGRFGSRRWGCWWCWRRDER